MLIKPTSENTQYVINQQYKLIYIGLLPAEILPLRDILSNNTHYCLETNICGAVVQGDDYSMGISFDEMPYSEAPNLISACSEGDFITTNFTAGDEVTCYSPCPSENVEMCGTNGCLSQLEPPICECISAPWFPEGDPNETDQLDFPSVEPCKAKVENWVVVVVPILAVILLVSILVYLRKRKKIYKVEEEKNDEISLNQTNDSDVEHVSVEQQQAVRAAPMQNRSYVNDSGDESTASETVSSQSDQSLRINQRVDDQNIESQRQQQNTITETETDTESETESEVSLRTKTKLVEREIRKVRKDIDFLKTCDDSSVTGIL